MPGGKGKSMDPLAGLMLLGLLIQCNQCSFINGSIDPVFINYLEQESMKTHFSSSLLHTSIVMPVVRWTRQITHLLKAKGSSIRDDFEFDRAITS